MLRINNLIGFGAVSAVSAEAADAAEAVSFDGSTDYLSRSSDLVGNADGKTFTFSTWVYNTRSTISRLYVVGGVFSVFIQADNTLRIFGAASAGGTALLATTIAKIPLNTFTHLLISIDMNSTSNRSIYLGDNLQTVTWTTYTNITLDFTDASHLVVSGVGVDRLKGRCSGMFLDYTYRDLSVEDNRRLFITADGKPAEDQASLSPILYLPMTDAATAHVNAGTGGNFVQNGVLDTASRGPNQDNGAMSVITAVDYLTHATENGATLSYWSIVNGVMTHTFSTGSVAIGNITTALGDAVGEVYLTAATLSESDFITAGGECIPVQKVISDTSDTPLVALPIRADSPGTNLGSAGDWTEVSAPFVGARGGSEFWARGAVVDGADYLTGSVYCESLVKWLSTDAGVTWTPTYSNAVTVTNIGNGTDNGVVAFYWGTSEDINWALEASKNRVTDQLGYPKDLVALVADNASTVLALPLDDITNFGKNLVGADFTMTGTITQGADVTA